MLCTVVLLDTSASMNQRTSSNISLLDAAKAAVPARLHTPSLPRIAVTVSLSLASMSSQQPFRNPRPAKWRSVTRQSGSFQCFSVMVQCLAALFHTAASHISGS
jgi:hypothetical protein